MENLIIKVNSNPNLRSSLFDIVDENIKDVPKSYDPKIIFTNISFSDITNFNDELYSKVTIAQFVKEHMEALKIVPTFKFSSLTNQWYFELSAKEFAKIRGWEVKQIFMKKMLNKYPIWKQLNLVNDKEQALLELSNLTQLNSQEIMKKIQEVISIKSTSSLSDIRDFQKNINNMDFKQFMCLKPITFKISDIQPWVISVLNYLSYYYASCRLRHIANNEEKKLNLLTTYEAISLFAPIDPIL